MQLIDLFESSLVGQRDEIALEYARAGEAPVTLTFGELNARSHRLARLLESRGLRAGDRLAVCLANRIEFID